MTGEPSIAPGQGPVLDENFLPGRNDRKKGVMELPQTIRAVFATPDNPIFSDREAFLAIF